METLLVLLTLAAMAGVIYPYITGWNRLHFVLATLGISMLSGYYTAKDELPPAEVSQAAEVPQSLESPDPDEMLWVGVQQAHRRTCPSDSCGSVGRYFYGDQPRVEEEKNGWVRVSRYYDASCSGGISDYVDSGEGRCIDENGIRDGQFAEWVKMSDLTNTEPSRAKPTNETKFIAMSDDFHLYESAFLSASNDLISQGRCTREDIENHGGWIKATMGNIDLPVYFLYCGGYHVSHRYYLDAETGRVYQ